MKILAIPKSDLPPTSERTPEIYRRLMKGHALVSLRARWDPIVYDVNRSPVLRLPLYLLDKLDLILRGLRLAKRAGVDLVFCGETYHNALSGLMIAKILGRPCIWDSHGNVLLFADSVGKGRLFRRVAGALERVIGLGVDTLVTVTDLDAEAYASMGIPRGKIHVFPSCVDVTDIDRRVRAWREEKESAPASGDSPPVILFFGSFRYEPNLEALRFVNEVLAPSLSQAGVRVKIQIAGRHIPPMPYHASLEILGFVQDIYPHIARADVAIVPIWKGVGILVKALDIMAVGTPMVATGFVVKGIPQLRNGEHALLANTQEEFIRILTHSLAGKNGLRGMSDRGRELVKEHYDWSRQWPRFERIIASTMRLHSP